MPNIPPVALYLSSRHAATPQTHPPIPFVPASLRDGRVNFQGLRGLVMKFQRFLSEAASGRLRLALFLCAHASRHDLGTQVVPKQGARFSFSALS